MTIQQHRISVSHLIINAFMCRHTWKISDDFQQNFALIRGKLSNATCLIEILLMDRENEFCNSFDSTQSANIANRIPWKLFSPLFATPRESRNTVGTRGENKLSPWRDNSRSSTLEDRRSQPSDQDPVHQAWSALARNEVEGKPYERWGEGG